MRSRRGSKAVQRYVSSTSTGSSSSVPGNHLAYTLPAMESLVEAGDQGSPTCIDLLHPEPCASIDHRACMKALEFAFAAGDSAGIASGALSRAAIAPSDWQPDSFQGELFVDELVESCLHFQIEGRPAPLATRHLSRLLCNPPRDRAITRFRHAILQELQDSPQLQKDLGSVYGHIVRLLSLFDEGGGGSRYTLPRWRLDLLGVLRDLLDSMYGPFETVGSGLSRLHTFASQVRLTQAYDELCALLDFEGDMARVDLHLRVGVDGRVRQLEIRQLQEHRTEPFYRGPLARFAWKALMFLRGYRVGEADLVERWFDHVYSGLLEYLPAILQLRGDLEFYLGACHFSRVAKEAGLEVCLPRFTDQPGDHKRMERLFNPLLLAEDRPPVPCTLDVASFERICVMTGPNSGGKTRLLQAIAFSQMFAQAGMFVPARSAVLRPSSGMFVSLGQESSADQKEGRLGTELMRIRTLFEKASPGSLVILDELCSGTNPSEGEEIFDLVVELLGELDPEVFITTHFLQFAAKLAERGGDRMCFLQVELDEQKVPTYQFIPGVATTSLAQQTAARLGVTREELQALISRSRNRSRR